MNRFDNRYNELLNEVLGSIAKNIATGVSSGLEAAKNPGAGVKNIISSLGSLQTNKQELLKQSFSLKNRPKLNQIVITTAPVYGIVLNSKTQQEKLTVIMPNATIFGKITKDMDNSGNYGVALTDEKGIPSQKYVFAQTESAPFWQIYDQTKLPVNDIKTEGGGDDFAPVDGSGGVSKDANNNPMVLKALITGPAKDDVSEPIRMWRDYKTYLLQQKK